MAMRISAPNDKCIPILNISRPALRGTIDKQNAGLHGVKGAEAIIQLLRMNRPVHRLVISHNKLKDAGCVALFDFLRSEEGKRHQIADISLNANEISDEGLWAIASYLEDNKSLTNLFLQNNAFQGKEMIMLRFVLAINSSNLQILSFTNNVDLGDAIANILLPKLSAKSLRELHLSACSLNPAALPTLLSYLTSPRGLSLRILKINGNPFGMRLLSHVIETLEHWNWSITSLEMHACGVGSEGILDGGDSWKTYEQRLRVVLDRNRILGTQTAVDALFLLHYARPALLDYGRQRIKGTRTPFPPEIAVHILSFLAPSLSSAQHTRVCTYAENPDTLPKLGLSMPMTSSYKRMKASHGSTYWQTMASRKDEERILWLRHVECDRYEPDQFESRIKPQIDQTSSDN